MYACMHAGRHPCMHVCMFVCMIISVSISKVHVSLYPSQKKKQVIFRSITSPNSPGPYLPDGLEWFPIVVELGGPGKRIGDKSGFDKNPMWCLLKYQAPSFKWDEETINHWGAASFWWGACCFTYNHHLGPWVHWFGNFATQQVLFLCAIVPLYLLVVSTHLKNLVKMGIFPR